MTPGGHELTTPAERPTLAAGVASVGEEPYPGWQWPPQLDATQARTQSSQSKFGS